MRYLLLVVFTFLPIHLSKADDIVPCDGPDCGTCQFFQLLHNIIFWAVEVLFLVTVLAFIVSGLAAVTSAGNAGFRTWAKRTALNAAIGFALVLGAVIIIDLFLKAFVPNTNVDGYLNRVSCVAPRVAPTPIPRSAPVEEEPTPEQPTVEIRPLLPPGEEECAECVELPEGLPFSAQELCGQDTCRLDPQLIRALQSLAPYAAEVDVDWEIGSAYPIVVNQTEVCYARGTCTNIPVSPEQVVALQELVEITFADNQTIVVSSEVEKRQFIEAGYQGSIAVDPLATESYFRLLSDSARPEEVLPQSVESYRILSPYTTIAPEEVREAYNSERFFADDYNDNIQTNLVNQLSELEAACLDCNIILNNSSNGVNCSASSPTARGYCSGHVVDISITEEVRDFITTNLTSRGDFYEDNCRNTYTFKQSVNKVAISSANSSGEICFYD